jgi:uncharacterized membrane protein YfcA
MTTTLLALVVGFGIGGLLGMLGGGGSILTVPALVYLMGQTPQAAVTTSLAIVGANSLIGAFFHRAQGTLNWRVALMFGGAGMITSYLAAGISTRISPLVLMVMFALLMLMVGAMLIRKKSAPHQQQPQQPLPRWKVLAGGALVGLLTGLLGVGGGFLIVPALVMLLGLPMHHAVGTSLVVIAMNSTAGFLGHLHDLSLDFTLVSVFISAGIVGTFAGTRLGRRIDAQTLHRAFGLLVIALAIYLLYDNLPKIVNL